MAETRSRWPLWTVLIGVATAAMTALCLWAGARLGEVTLLGEKVARLEKATEVQWRRSVTSDDLALVQATVRELTGHVYDINTRLAHLEGRGRTGGPP